jgi:tetratricopeptide (TPR) repeat protein
MVINNMRKIFISYSREDQLFARSICFALREAGGEVWYDEHDMDTGRLTPSIEGALQRSNIMVLLLSASALTSAWVSREVSWFCQLQKIDPSRQIVPVTVRAVDPAEIWPSIQDFVRIEGPRGAPLPHDKAILRLLGVLGLARSPLPDDDLARARFGESAADLYENAMALYKRGLAAEALPLMRRAAELSADRSERFRIWASLGIVQQALNRLDDALRSFDRALAIFDDARTWFNKSIALERLGRLAEAVDANDAALRAASAALDEGNENYWGHYERYSKPHVIEKKKSARAASNASW